MKKWVVIVSLFLLGCGEATPPDNCVMGLYTYYAYNTVTGLWQGPVIKPLCMVQ